MKEHMNSIWSFYEKIFVYKNVDLLEKKMNEKSRLHEKNPIK